MLATSFARSRKAVLAAGLCFFLLVLLLWHSPTSSSWKDNVDYQLETAYQWINPAEAVKAEYIEDAHKLSSADAFRPHFRAVLDIPPTPAAEIRAACTWSKEEEKDKINFMWLDTQEWVKNPWNESHYAEERSKWHSFMRNELVPWKPHASKFRGRGIVIAGGNGKSLARMEVLLRQLVRLGSELPVEVHYWDQEISPEQMKAVQSWFPRIRFCDLSLKSNPFLVEWADTDHGKGFRVNYHLKVAAILNSRFAEILLLDSDNIPVILPEDNFESRTYQEYSTVFWPDNARTRPQSPIWGITNTPCRMDEYEQESGQMLVDKRKFWYHLQLSLWFMRAEQMGTYFTILLGDKDAFRFAWKALKTPYGQPTHFVSSVGYRPKPDTFCGISFGQYHPDDNKIAFLHANGLKSHHAKTMEWLSKNREGPFSWIKKSPHDDDYSFNVKGRLVWDDEKYLPDGPYSDMRYPPQCSDAADLEPIRLEEVIPGGFERIWREIRNPVKEGDTSHG